MTEIEQLKEKLTKREDALRGLSWMFDKGVLIRDVSHDHEPDYTSRSMKFALWISRAFKGIE